MSGFLAIERLLASYGDGKNGSSAFRRFSIFPISSIQRARRAAITAKARRALKNAIRALLRTLPERVFDRNRNRYQVLTKRRLARRAFALAGRLP
jgi:hypothetical protein